MVGPREHSFTIETPKRRSGDTGTRHSFVVHAESLRDLALARRAIQMLDRKTVITRVAKQAERIDRLVEAMIEDEPRSALDEALEIDNAALRARYLESVPTYTAAELHAIAGSSAANRSALASGWKADGRVFAVPHRGVDRFPAFQFADGRPRAVVASILEALPEGMTPWQIAFWFASGNGWLEDAAPADRMDDADAVLQAARRMREPTIG